ncbi:fibroblast growth factor-binding protein 1-like [Mastacembelus armatus]|uniref:Fibroblast growth factor binding protein 1b n=1 Tax=Mastacembelus armatus TaxID=205130 RepID=A0A7N9AT80_9TELE|nr:fibroblast growth factor-binding protein 1 [Mastacembelus armatus]
MRLLRTLAPWLLLAFLGQQVSLCSGARNKSRGIGKPVTPAPERAHRSGNRPAATGRGKFSTKDKMQCTWVARDDSDAVNLSVKCQNPDAQCDYTAKPQSCPSYLSDPRSFWKQMARALKKLQGKVCKDERALVKAGVCKYAPRDAHFKLSSSGALNQSGRPETPPPVAPPTECTGRADHRKTAEEYCSSSWASVCALFFSMFQRDC